MKKILDKDWLSLGVLILIVWYVVLSSAAMSLIAIVFMWIGNIGKWYFNFSVSIRLVSSFVIAGCYLIGRNRPGGWKKIFKSIADFWED